MLVIGLTGSIGMGKSTAALRFRELGIGVFDADADVHRLYEGSLVAEIEAVFPGSTENGKVDRAKLSAQLMKSPERMKVLEAIVHPRVRANERDFLGREYAKGAPMAVLEIPLLFESGAAGSVDVVIVVSAPPALQRERVLARPGMTAAKLDSLLARQWPDEKKRAAAHFVVDTSGSIEASRAQIDAIVAELRPRTGTAYARFWS